MREAAVLLAQFGALVTTYAEIAGGGLLEVKPPGRPWISVALREWNGEHALRDELARLGEGRLSPTGDVLGAYAAYGVAGAATLPDAPLTVIETGDLVREMLAAVAVRGATRPELVRCRDGWLVARWRDPSERDLFEALVAANRALGLQNAVAAAREARLLVAPVRPPRSRPRARAGTGCLVGLPATPAAPRIVDWTVLWAGPWAARQLHDSGALVERIEHPGRRDGLLGWPAGRRWWNSLNAGKRLHLLDARLTADRERLRQSIATADILITSMTPRALRSLGFDDRWRDVNAPRLLHLELVAFEDPWSDAPGLGEHAAAEAGLLWRDGATPAAPYPWADALLGACTLAVSRIWLASSRRRGGRIRLSLEQAARLAFAPVTILAGPRDDEPWHRLGAATPVAFFKSHE